VKHDKFKCLYFNARNLVHKIIELELLVKSENSDIIGISKTWLNVNILDSEMSIEGYTLLRKDRSDNRRGGGVALYIKNELNFVYCEDLFEIEFPESLFCSLICEKERTLIGVCYRPPNSLSVNDRALFSLLNRISKDRLVVMGDFNYPELKWSEPESLSDSHPFLKCLNDNFLEQLVDESTREDNILDLVITSDDSIISNLSVGEPFETSDHQMIIFELTGKRHVAQNLETGFNYFKSNYNEIRNYFEEQNGNILSNNEDLNSCWILFRSELMIMRNKFVPKLKKK
jgi:Endonuclease-reverse transcriptase